MKEIEIEQDLKDLFKKKRGFDWDSNSTTQQQYIEWLELFILHIITNQLK